MRIPYLQQIIREQARTMFVGGVIMFMLVISLMAVAAWGYFVPKARATCSSFGPYTTQDQAKISYNNALRAFSAGAYWLDNDGDGRPCETLYKAAYPKGQSYGE